MQLGAVALSLTANASFGYQTSETVHPKGVTFLQGACAEREGKG